MYKKAKLIDTVRLPPERLGEETIAVVKDLLRDKLEGRIDKMLGSIIAITDVLDIGEGRILAGDGAIYYDVTFNAITFKPQLQEILEGKVVEIVEFGAFVGLGPLDGLLHVSQIADDYISYDEKKCETGRKRDRKGHYGRRYAAGSRSRSKLERTRATREQDWPDDATSSSGQGRMAC